ncbi:DUF551 domain-containing protein [Acinetobacter baumannii]|uniref:DUF551 domain-containing protein n=1 Tax=Acinetobacter baumannii TaxID=470 RepID=UPI003AF4F0BB
MTDLNKLRSEFEAVTEIYHCIYNADLDYYFSGSKFASDKAEIEVNAGWKSWKKAKAQAVPEWISVEDRMPEPLRNVLVLIDANPAKNQNQMVAHFIPKFTEEYHGDDDWYDYDEERGCGYVKEGWYANTVYIGDEYSSYFIEEKVAHWKPLKEASESGAEK